MQKIIAKIKNDSKKRVVFYSSFTLKNFGYKQLKFFLFYKKMYFFIYDTSFWVCIEKMVLVITFGYK